MRYGIFSLILCFSFLLTSNVSVAQDAAQQDGANTFKTICATCHTIGRGRLVGPDLAGVTQKQSQDWLLKFIRSSQTVIKSGDKTADSLFQAFNKTIMPDQPTLDDTKIKNVLAYIDATTAGAATSSGGGTNQPATAPVTEKFLTQSNIWLMIGMLAMLIVILALARINKNLADQIRDFYSSDRSFFKK